MHKYLNLQIKYILQKTYNIDINILMHMQKKSQSLYEILLVYLVSNIYNSL